MTEPELVTRSEFEIYAKAVNGSLARIEGQLLSIDDKLDRCFENLTNKIENERNCSLESHRRIHNRIEQVEKNKVSKITAILITCLSSITVGLITGCLVALIK